jgi:hypothetical protein
MRKLLLAVILIATAYGVQAQNVPSKKTKKTKKTSSTKKSDKGTWKKGGMVNIALSQAGTRNWAPGGDRLALSVNTFFTAYANKTKAKSYWNNRIEASYGFMNTNAYGIVKNDDRVELISRYNHQIGKVRKSKWSYGAIANFRTQLTDGYDFDNGNKKRISSFLAPAYFLFSPGMSYDVCKDLNVHFSPITPRWVIVSNRPNELAANYDVKANREVRIEAGIFTSLNFKKEIMKNVYYRSRLDLFSDFVDRAPGNIDVFWNNMITMKVNKNLQVVYNFDLQYDDNTKIFGYTKKSPGTQLKSVFGVGLAAKF